MSLDHTRRTPRQAGAPRALIAAATLLTSMALTAGALAAQATTQTTTSPARTGAPRPGAAMRTAITPFQRGDRFFVGKPDGAVYVGDRTGNYRLLLPAAAVPYRVIAPSPNGRYIAYGIAASPTSRNYDVHVRDVVTAQDLPTVLHHAAITTKPWTADERGFFYTRSDTTEQRERVVYHHINEAQSRDAVVFSEFSHPEFTYDAEVSDDGEYAVFTINHPQDAKTAIAFLDVQNPGKPKLDAPVVRLVDNFGSRWRFIDDAGTYFIMQTDRGAPHGKVVLADLNMTREADWTTVVPEQSDTLAFARTAGNQYLLAVYRSTDGASRARLYGPPNPRIVQAERRARLDSLRKAQRDRERAGGPPPISEAMLGRTTLRLEPHTDLMLPPGATVLGMHSIADRNELFYTLRLADGSVHAYRYDVKSETPVVFEPTLPAAGR